MIKDLTKIDLIDVTIAFFVLNTNFDANNDKILT